MAQANLVIIIVGVIVTVVVVAVSVLLVPERLIENIKPVRQLRAKAFKSLKRLAFLSTQGPFYKLLVWSGKRCCCGRLCSPPSPPTGIKAKPTSWHEALLYWAPTLPKWNPFHEEKYVCSWRRDGPDEKWHVKTVELGDYEDSGKRMKMGVDALPENSIVHFRVAAVSFHGRSDWSASTTIRTLVRPREDGGYWGPLGPACKEFPEGRDRYRWVQARGSIEIKVPIPEDWKFSEIRITKTPVKLELAREIDGNLQVVLSGSLCHRVKIDEVFWQFEESEEDGKHIDIQMTKEDPLIQWSCVFDGDQHPSIDTKYVRLLQDGMNENIDWLKENARITRRNE